jgi:hypothetical protein
VECARACLELNALLDSPCRGDEDDKNTSRDDQVKSMKGYHKESKTGETPPSVQLST